MNTTVKQNFTDLFCGFSQLADFFIRTDILRTVHWVPLTHVGNIEMLGTHTVTLQTRFQKELRLILLTRILQESQ